MWRSSRIRLTLLLTLTLGTGVVASAQPANETGKKRCNDGIDNDGDGLIDLSDPDCNGGGGGTAPASLTLLLSFDFNGTPSTIGPFEAVVECGNTLCEFKADPGGVDVFNIPSADFVDLINSTEVHGTLLDAETCYDFDGDGMLQLTQVDTVSVRAYNDPSLGWEADASGWGCDLDSVDLGECDPRYYHFKFRGPCDPAGCAVLPPAAGGSLYETGVLQAIWINGHWNKDGIGCRCTFSNDPGCPAEAAEMSMGAFSVPSMEVLVEEIP